MRHTVVLFVLATVPIPSFALAQSVQNPLSVNGLGADSAIVPRLPTPPIDDDSPPLAFLRAATQALAAGRTGEAQEAMERAESRVLDRSVRPSQAKIPDTQPLIRAISAARAALAAGDRAQALRLLQSAMADPTAG